MKRYQWLLFDADGTLFDYDAGESTALKQVFQLIGVTFEPGHLAAYRKINEALWQAFERGEVAPGFIKTRRFELLLDTMRIDYSPAALGARYLECLAECAQLIEDAADVVQALQAKYRMAILTNGLQVVQRGRLARSVIRPHIAEIVISEEIGFAKPAREFFDMALARLGNPARHELLMIGDGWASDMAGAIGYGIDACWYNPAQKPRPSGGEITREIASLRELIEWLG